MSMPQDPGTSASPSGQRDPRRRFTRIEIRAMFEAQDGRCAAPDCNADLQLDLEGDHIYPWAAGGPTNVSNGQLLCRLCNRRKGSRILTGRPLLQWQQQAVDKFVTASASRFLFAVCPGGGKTEAASAACAAIGAYAVVLVPQDDATGAWRTTLHGRGLCPAVIGPRGGAVGSSCAARGCGKPTRAVVMTNAYVLANTNVLIRVLKDHPNHLLILDEPHHLREDGGWWRPLRDAHPYIRRVLCLSGTPFRSDEEAIPFIHTTDASMARRSLIPDTLVYDYPYGKAVGAKPPVVSRVIFERYDGDISWLEGTQQVERSAKLSHDNDQETRRKARRHALNPRGNWLPTVLADADRRLDDIRSTGLDEAAGGVIICYDTDHAVAVADLRARLRPDEPVAVYTQQYATLSHHPGNGRLDEKTERRPGHEPSVDVFTAYKDGATKWLVTVRKVSEGVDIPRLRVLVYATTYSTYLFFLQALGRVIRLRHELPRKISQTAWVYIPDDRTMKDYAATIEDAVADALLADLEEEPPEDDDESHRRTRTDSGGRIGDCFIEADPTYAGVTFAGTHLDPALREILNSARAERPEEVLNWVRNLESSGYRISRPAEPAVEFARVDPLADLDEKRNEKNDVVKAWAGQRLRKTDEFKNFTEAVRACNKELGKMFGVWAENAEVNVEQLGKATQYAKERLAELRKV